MTDALALLAVCALAVVALYSVFAAPPLPRRALPTLPHGLDAEAEAAVRDLLHSLHLDR